MRVYTYCYLTKKDLMSTPIYINGEYVYNPLNLDWEYTTPNTIDYYQYEIEKISYDKDGNGIKPDIHLNPIKPSIDIREKEQTCLFEFISLLESDIQYYVHPRFYKDNNGHKSHEIIDNIIFKIEWDNKDKCYYIL